MLKASVIIVEPLPLVGEWAAIKVDGSKTFN